MYSAAEQNMCYEIFIPAERVIPLRSVHAVQSMCHKRVYKTSNAMTAACKLGTLTVIVCADAREIRHGTSETLTVLCST